MSKFWSVSKITGDGYTLDRALGALFFGAKHDETISQMAALGQQQDRRWACLLCGLLSVIVEKDHCAKSVSDTPTAAPAALRAGIALLMLTLAMMTIPAALFFWVW